METSSVIAQIRSVLAEKSYYFYTWGTASPLTPQLVRQSFVWQESNGEKGFFLFAFPVLFLGCEEEPIPYPANPSGNSS